ncbi:MAG: ABC transporter permease subunit, partial [Actinomycetota bacterium]
MSLSRRQRLRLVRGGVYAATIAALVLILLAVDWGALGGALFKWEIVKEQFPDILTNALRNTVIFTIFGFAGGLSLGLLLAIMRLSSVKPYRWFAATYIEVLRGIPLLVTLLI